MTYAGIARNASEREQALILAEASFSPQDKTKNNSTLRKTFLLCGHPGYTNDSPIVVCAGDDSVVASAFLIDCTVSLHHRLLQGVFVSSVSVAETARGQGLSLLLMRAAIDSASARQIDIAMVIARRAVDGFYTRFGFWGLAQYSKVTFQIASLPIDKLTPRKVYVLPLAVDNFETCSAFYAANYAHLAGHCLRKPEMWAYILGKLPYLGLRLDMVLIGGIIVGYAVHDSNGNLYEIATVTGAQIFSVRSFLLAFVGSKDSLTLHIPPAHPFMSRLEGADVSLTLRECPYGGHMIRILNPALADGMWNGKSDSSDAKVAHLGFAETARCLRLSRVTDSDVAHAPEMLGSFNIPILDQI